VQHYREHLEAVSTRRKRWRVRRLRRRQRFDSSVDRPARSAI